MMARNRSLKEISSASRGMDSKESGLPLRTFTIKMAFSGQLAAQTPQPMHKLGLRIKVSSPVGCEIASMGHISRHVSQRVHCSG